ncbi:SAM-dependent methyltransferase [Rhodopirellula sp. MGV]|nr:SAM-dependent methyltransferase [Rhodopirellula sp. MGV]PNY37343.1 class I SAM-dependent methyltransferase [Rhodopirellula baltica]
MTPEELTDLFDQQAANYDAQWAKTEAIRNCLFLLLDSHFAELPENSRVLCVGAGTGAEMEHFAKAQPDWSFTVVEPSGEMLELCRERAEAGGFADRCVFHHGYLETLEMAEQHDAATSFLVSQFFLDRDDRRAFFAEIASRLKPNGLLASSDLSCDQAAADYDVLLESWMRMLAMSTNDEAVVARIRKAYVNDVAVRPIDEVTSIIKSAGFENATPFFQAGLIHAWISTR